MSNGKVLQKLKSEEGFDAREGERLVLRGRAVIPRRGLRWLACATRQAVSRASPRARGLARRAPLSRASPRARARVFSAGAWPRAACALVARHTILKFVDTAVAKFSIAAAYIIFKNYGRMSSPI